MSASNDRRPRQSGGIRQRKGKWIASVEGNPNPQTGKRRRIEKACNSEAEARIELQRLYVKVHTKKDVALKKDMTLEAWMAAWLKQKKLTLRPRTMRNYERWARYITHDCGLGKNRLDKLTKPMVAHMDDYLLSNHSQDVAHSVHSMLETALQDAIRIDLITQNVAGRDGPKPPPIPKRSSKRLTAAQAAKFMERHREHPNITRWLFALMTGARQSEVLGLRWQDINWDDGEVRIDKELELVSSNHGCGDRLDDGTWPCWKRRAADCPDRKIILPQGGRDYIHLWDAYHLGPVKSRTSNRVIPIPEALLQELRRHRNETKDIPNPWGFVWTREEGKPLDPSKDYMQWRDLLIDAKLPHVNLHSARKTAASVLVSLGADMTMVQRILGHSNMSITEIYADVDREAIRSAMAKMGTILGTIVEDKELGTGSSIHPIEPICNG